jgi:electron transport complex protein RnfA
MEYLHLFIGTVLINNVVLVKFLGLCPFMGASNNLNTAIGMGLATTFVLTLSSVCSWLLQTYLLVPFNIEFLRILTFILVVAALVQFTEMVTRKISPALYKALGIYLPLITTNCAVLGVALINVSEQHNFFQSFVYGLGASLGFTLVMIIFGGLRQRLAMADVPEVFDGAPVGLVTAGLLSMIFMGFSGLV